MEKKNINWSELGFGYMPTEKRYVSNYKNGAWDEGGLTDDATITMSECAGVLQYAQTVFEGLKAYTTEDGRTVMFRPDLNASRLADSARRLEIPAFPEDRFMQAVNDVVKANLAYVPPYGSGATLYIRPFIFGSSSVIGVKHAEEYHFRIFEDPAMIPYFAYYWGLISYKWETPDAGPVRYPSGLSDSPINVVIDEDFMEHIPDSWMRFGDNILCQSGIGGSSDDLYTDKVRTNFYSSVTQGIRGDGLAFSHYLSMEYLTQSQIDALGIKEGIFIYR